MPQVRIENRFSVQTFNGELLAQTQTPGPPERQRWVEIAVYKLDDGPGYVLHRIGKSVVYHRADTHCTTSDGRQRGDEATVSDLPDNADPCELCQPPYPEELGDNDKIRFEFDRNTVNKCATAARVIDKLTVYRSPAAGRPGDEDTGRAAKTSTVSAPVRELLEKLASKDPAFATRPDIKIA